VDQTRRFIVVSVIPWLLSPTLNCIASDKVISAPRTSQKNTASATKPSAEYDSVYREANVKTSSAGIAIIKRHEGLRLTAYRCPAGVWTIGYGLTSAAGIIQVKRGLRITEIQAEEYLVKSLLKYEAAVDAALKRPPTQNEFDSMTSLCFNIGPDAFARSSVVKFFNAGERRRSADSFKLWVKGGRPKRRMAGLVKRRADERKHFLTA
jgi:lysozyme